MAAIATTLLTLARPGDVIIHSDPLYGGTDHLLRSLLPQFDIREVGLGSTASTATAPDGVAVSGAAGAGVEDEIVEMIERYGPDRVAAVYVETPGNPTNALTDLAALRRGIDRACGPDPVRRIPLVVDNTFLGPIWQRPLEHGADLVVYSATKYLGGHSDLIAGAVLGDAELVGRITATRLVLGTIASPHTAWLLLRSLETLRIRTQAQEANARIVADHLAAHPKVARVAYLGHLRPGDPDHEIYERQCLGPGAMISIWLDPSEGDGSAAGDECAAEAAAFRFLDALRVIRLAVSLGSTESLAQHPATMTHVGVPIEERRRLGITPSLIRLSVGIEHPDDLLADLDRALAAV
jgi:methionine-gamma-lyase